MEFDIPDYQPGFIPRKGGGFDRRLLEGVVDRSTPEVRSIAETAMQGALTREDAVHRAMVLVQIAREELHLGKDDNGNYTWTPDGGGVA